MAKRKNDDEKAETAAQATAAPQDPVPGQAQEEIAAAPGKGAGHDDVPAKGGSDSAGDGATDAGGAGDEDNTQGETGEPAAMAGDPGAGAEEADEDRPHPFERLSQADRNLIGAMMAANHAHDYHTCRLDEIATTAWCPAMGNRVFTKSPALETAGAFVRANRDAKPETMVIELRRRGFRDTPEIGQDEALRAAWLVFLATLSTLDAASEAAKARRAALAQAANERKGPPAARPHELAENPLRRHPLTQQGRMLAGKKI